MIYRTILYDLVRFETAIHHCGRSRDKLVLFFHQVHRFRGEDLRGAIGNHITSLDWRKRLKFDDVRAFLSSCYNDVSVLLRLTEMSRQPLLSYKFSDVQSRSRNRNPPFFDKHGVRETGAFASLDNDWDSTGKLQKYSTWVLMSDAKTSARDATDRERHGPLDRKTRIGLQILDTYLQIEQRGHLLTRAWR